METSMDNRLLHLSDRDLLELPDARGTTLHVAQGSVWITQQDDRRDIVLRAGDTWTLERPGLALAQAQGDTKVMLFRSGKIGNTQGLGGRWEARITKWFERTAERHLRLGWHM
jgi:hypothetical protein